MKLFGDVGRVGDNGYITGGGSRRWGGGVSSESGPPPFEGPPNIIKRGNVPYTCVCKCATF